MKNLNLTKFKKIVHTNKQMFVGLVVGALVMLPTGLYVSERSNNRQANDSFNSSQESLEIIEMQENTPLVNTEEKSVPTSQTAQPAPQAQPASKIDVCVDSNASIQKLLVQFEASSYEQYQTWKRYYQQLSESDMNASIDSAYNDYRNTLERDYESAENKLLETSCVPTINQVSARTR